MGKEHAESNVSKPLEKAPDASQNDNNAPSLSQSLWSKDQAAANKLPAERTADENQRLHELGAKAISDIFKEFKEQDEKNPNPSTWKYDEKGHLLKAGERVNAQYDEKGDLSRAQIDDHIYEKIGNDVVETYKDHDGNPAKYTTKNVKDFTLNTVDGDLHGPYKSIDLEVRTASGSGLGELTQIWMSPEHSQFLDDYWSGKLNKN